jgi:hypothetical protein
VANQFFGFSPESFEQFARAVALSVFGPGVTMFGNGPDGGREATFRGGVPYPYPPATLDVDRFPEPATRLAAVLVRLAQPSLSGDEATRLAGVACAVIDAPAEGEADTALFSTAERHLHRVPAIGQFLLRLRDQMPASVELGRARCEGLLRQALRTLASDLHTPGRLAKLELPEVPTH